MELIHLNQTDFNELRLEKIDFLITASSNQPRCFHLAEKLHQKTQRKIVLVSRNEDQRKDENQYLSHFNVLGFSEHVISSDSEMDFKKLLETNMNVPVHYFNLVIDYSCMPKKWYAQFIDTLQNNTYLAEKINLFLSYTPKVFEKQPDRHAIEYIGPILLNRDVLKEKKPVSVIAALDNKHNSITEAISKIKPDKFMAFVPHCAHDPEYTNRVIENNRALLKKLDNNSVINYDADRPEEINTLLTSYCLDERIDSEVMIIPQGPKTFSMMSMLLSLRYPDVKLWEVIHKDQKIKSEHGHPAANPIIVKASFICDDDADDE